MNSQKLVSDGYFSTSNKYRTLARLTSEKSPLQILKEVDPISYQRIERSVLAQLFRCYNEPFIEKLELTEEEFSDFKKSGGEVA